MATVWQQLLQPLSSLEAAVKRLEPRWLRRRPVPARAIAPRCSRNDLSLAQISAGVGLQADHRCRSAAATCPERAVGRPNGQMLRPIGLADSSSDHKAELVQRKLLPRQLRRWAPRAVLERPDAHRHNGRIRRPRGLALCAGRSFFRVFRFVDMMSISNYVTFRFVR